MDAILNATYSAADVAHALQHQSFANFQREVGRSGALLLPRRRGTGPGAANYRYPHLVELAFLIRVAYGRGRAGARAAFWGLLLLLQEQAVAKMNTMSSEERRAILTHRMEFEEGEYPAGAPHELGRAVEFPSVYFGADFLSRDPENPTFFMFDPQPFPDAPARGMLLTGTVTLADAHQQLANMKTGNVAKGENDSWAREPADDMPIINLTTMLARIDDRLALRLKSREMRGA